MDGKTRPFLCLCFLLFLFSSKCYVSRAAETMGLGESLTGKQTLTSKGGNFELGFFKPGPSPKYYLAIWYKKVSKPTAVWVANRETPLSDDSPQVRIAEDGNLVILDQSKGPVWSTNSSLIGSNSTVVELLDSGNLVLRHRSNSTAIFWQSFDHPTDTWLPGGWLGFDKRTGETQLLTSWKSSEDPAPGPFSLELDPNGTSQYFIRWNRTLRYWTSGLWNGQIFSLVPEMRSTYNYNYSFETTDKGNYFTYYVYDPSLISRFVMDLTGQIKQFNWFESSQQWNVFWSQPRAQCDVLPLCGPFGICNADGLPPCGCAQGFEPTSPNDWNLSDWSGGCVRKSLLTCDDKDGFSLLTAMRPPANGQLLSAVSREECEFACRSDCSCTAFSFSNGCSVWKGDLLNLQNLSEGGPGAIDLSLRLADSDLSRSENSSSRGLLVGAIVGPVAGIAALLGVVFMMRRRTRSITTFNSGSGSLVAFSYRDLQSITKNFSEKLGSGGFGSVFRGTLPNSSIVAVKKLEGLGQGEKQFRAEVSTIGTIQHLNLSRLRGFCSEGSQRLLVYDYMSRGSLDSHLFNKNSEALKWETRYQVALGTARGLAYLHEECRDCIIHCDIKPENILLDESFCPKVADFGLAKLVGREFSRVLTTMRGTRGYLAPEWISGLAITTKADVYSYGMMVFEIISGRRNIEQSGDGKVLFFPTWAAKRIMEGEVLSLLDSRLLGEADLVELSRVCRVACWCIQDDEEDRPSMVQVVKVLEGLLEVNIPPVPRSLQLFELNSEHIVTITDSESSSDQTSQTLSRNSKTKSSKSSSSASSS
ncbi:G-type lectin S-receptor-like serine/threonine-protein kinase At2g19130 [Aristolochia californica]|uniref:G-type lectin S-receptor-like serine/threonine-protein kinase At2g19130 n=1 Tax=Aristolochia californica TaxID=171875 RepID=UPI0035E1CA3D